jgi:hypothetical protein
MVVSPLQAMFLSQFLGVMTWDIHKNKRVFNPLKSLGHGAVYHHPSLSLQPWRQYQVLVGNRKDNDKSEPYITYWTIRGN